MEQAPELQPQKLLGVKAAQDLFQHYKKNDKLEEARIVAQYLHDHFKNFEMGMEFAATLIFDDKTQDALKVYFEIALESVQWYQIPHLKKCVGAISEQEDLLDASQKSVLNMLKRFLN